MNTFAYPFTPDMIRGVVPPGRPGVYMLGEVVDGSFLTHYVGRSDHCLRTRLLTHDHRGKWSYFVFLTVRSAEEAALLECKWWHDQGAKHGKLFNKIHPAVPHGQNGCPYCDFARGMKKLFRLKNAG